MRLPRDSRVSFSNLICVHAPAISFCFIHAVIANVAYSLVCLFTDFSATECSIGFLSKTTFPIFIQH